MRWMRWTVLAAALMLPLAACETQSDETGAEEADVEVEEVPEPDVEIEDQQPDVIIDEEPDTVVQEDEGFDANVSVDEDGDVSGNAEVNER